MNRFVSAPASVYDVVMRKKRNAQTHRTSPAAIAIYGLHWPTLTTIEPIKMFRKKPIEKKRWNFQAHHSLSIVSWFCRNPCTQGIHASTQPPLLCSYAIFWLHISSKTQNETFEFRSQMQVHSSILNSHLLFLSMQPTPRNVNPIRDVSVFTQNN